MSYGFILPDAKITQNIFTTIGDSLFNISHNYNNQENINNYKYLSAKYIESVMYWMNEIVRIHKMKWCENDTILETDIINEERFKWYRYNPNKEEFIPEYNGENLIGYPWNIQEFWFDFRKKIDFIMRRTRLYKGIHNILDIIPATLGDSSIIEWDDIKADTTEEEKKSCWIYQRDIKFDNNKNIITYNNGNELDDAVFHKYGKFRLYEYLQFSTIDGIESSRFSHVYSAEKIFRNTINDTNPLTYDNKLSCINDAYNAYLTTNIQSGLSSTGACHNIAAFDGWDRVNDFGQRTYYYQSIFSSHFSFSIRFLRHNRGKIFSLRNSIGCNGEQVLKFNTLRDDERLYHPSIILSRGRTHDIYNLQEKEHILAYGVISLTNEEVYIEPYYNSGPFISYDTGNNILLNQNLRDLIAERIYNKIKNTDYTVISSDITINDTVEININDIFDEEFEVTEDNPEQDIKILFIVSFLNPVDVEYIVDPNIHTGIANYIGDYRIIHKESISEIEGNIPKVNDVNNFYPIKHMWAGPTYFTMYNIATGTFGSTLNPDIYNGYFFEISKNNYLVSDSKIVYNKFTDQAGIFHSTSDYDYYI